MAFNIDEIEAAINGEAVSSFNIDEIEAAINEGGNDEESRQVMEGIDYNDRLVKAYKKRKTSSDKLVRDTASEIVKENLRRKKVLSELDDTSEKSGLEEKWDEVKTFGKLLASPFTSASTNPSKVYTEWKARNTKEGEPSFDVEQTLGSSVNVGKSLLPGGESPSEALANFTTKSPEGHKTFIKNLYKKDIIDKNGVIDYESLQYSDLSRYIQNDLAALWATQRTGIDNLDLFKGTIRARAGVVDEDNSAEAVFKRLFQAIDGALFNIPTERVVELKLGDKYDIYGEPKGKLKEDGFGTSRGQKEATVTFFDPVKGQDGKWYVETNIKGDFVPVPDYELGGDDAENKRRAARAILMDTKQKMEIQAMETGAQILDPSLLFGAGIGKKLVQYGVKATGSLGAKVANKVGAILPFAGNAGAITAVARASHLPMARRAIVDVARSDTAAGKALRSVDRVLTTTALMSAAASIGAPEGAEVDAGVAAGLLSLGLSPIQIMSAWKPGQHALDARNRDALKEIVRVNGDVKKLSNYSRKVLREEMARVGAGTPQQYIEKLNSTQAIANDLVNSMKELSSTETSPTVIIEFINRFAEDPKAQRDLSEMYKVFDNKGRSFEGYLATDSLKKALQQQEDNLKTAQDGGPTVGHGTSTITQNTMLARARDQTKAAIEALPIRVLNDGQQFTEWLEGNINGTPIQGLPILGPDTAKAALGQWKATNRGSAYFSLAANVFVIATALKDHAPLVKASGAADLVTNYEQLKDVYRNYLFDANGKIKDDARSDVLQFFNNMKNTGDSSNTREGLVEKMIRRSSKAEQSIISPAAASTVIANDLDNAVQLVSAKKSEAALIDEQRKAYRENAKLTLGAKWKDNPQYIGQMKAFSDTINLINEEIKDIVDSTQLSMIYKHSKDIQDKLVTHQGELAGANKAVADELTDINSAINKDIKDRMVRGTKTKQDRLIEKSERLAADSAKELQDAYKKAEARETELIARSNDSLEGVIQAIPLLDKNYPLPRKGDRSLFSDRRFKRDTLKKARDLAKQGNSPAAEAIQKAVKGYEGAMALLSAQRRKKANLWNDEAMYNREAPITQQMAKQLATINYSGPKDLGQWFDDFLAGADSLGIANTEYYKHIRQKVNDVLETNQPALTGGAPLTMLINPREIAMVRMLGKEAFLDTVLGVKIGPQQKPLFDQYARKVNALADTLVHAGQNSAIQREALKKLDMIAKNPARGKLSQLLQADRQFSKYYHVKNILSEGTTKQYTTKIEDLLNRVRDNKLKLTKADYRLMQVLATDSAIGKAYVTTKELEGLGFEPWMIPYKQDVTNMLDTMLEASSKNIDRILAETKTFLTDTGYLTSPDSFNNTVAAAFLFGEVHGIGGTGDEALFHMLSLANAWQKKTEIFDTMMTTENIAVALDRKTGMGIAEDMRTVLDAAQEAGRNKDVWGKKLIAKLTPLAFGNEAYVEHMRPSSPVQQYMNRMLVGTVDRNMIDTNFVDFYKLGEYDAETISGKNPAKAYPTQEAAEKARKAGLSEHFMLTDHLIVNGKLTTMGMIAEEIHKNLGAEAPKVIDRFLERNIPERQRLADPESYDILRRFVHSRLSPQSEGGFGKLDNYDQWNLMKTAVGIIQKHDAEGLKILNNLTDEYNKRYGTAFSKIEYNPWRLDTEVATTANMNIRDVGSIGSYEDADKFMGNRYSTTPAGQIHKARIANLKASDILFSPEANYLSRYSRLENDIRARTARFNLKRKAIFLEVAGHKEAAKAIKERIIEAGLIAGEAETFAQRWQRKVSASDNKGLIAASLLARQLINPMVMLARMTSTVFEQPLQQMSTSISSRPNAAGIMRSAQEAATHIWNMFPGFFSGLVNSLAKDTLKLSELSNGENIKVSGRYAEILERLYSGATKRIDPYTQAVLQEGRRGGDGVVKRSSLYSATGRVSMEAVGNRMMWAIKEKAENTAVRSTLNILGGVMETGGNILRDKGEAELVKYLNNFLGTTSNPSLILNVVSELKKGNIDVGWEKFGREYIAARVGTWNHMNIPKEVRSIARYVPGADQFYTAATLGTYRLIGSIVGIENMPPAIKARLVMSAASLLAISGGLAFMKSESNIDWFQRISPLGWFTSAAGDAMGDAGPGQAARNLVGNMMTRAEVRSGASYGLIMKGAMSMGRAIDALINKSEDADATGEDSEDLSNFFHALFDMTFIRPGISFTFHTQKELADAFSYQKEPFDAGVLFTKASKEGLISTEDIATLALSLHNDNNKVSNLMNKLIDIEEQDNESPYKTGEELAIGLLSLWANAMSTANDIAWEDQTPGWFAESPGRRAGGNERLRNLLQGEKSGSPAASAILRITEEAIARYDARNAKNAELLAGDKRPRPPSEEVGEGDGVGE